MAIRVPGEFHEDKMRQHKSGSIQCKPVQAMQSGANEAMRDGYEK